MGPKLEFNRVTLERPMLLVPGASPVKVRIARVPVPLTPGPDPRSVSAVEAIVPPTLSIVPGMKKVAPTVGRKGPSTIETDERVPGAKLRSNWKAYKFVTLEIFTSSVTLFPTFTLELVGSMLNAVWYANVGDEKMDAINAAAIIALVLKRNMFFSLFLATEIIRY
jgi:hypothetical protein